MGTGYHVPVATADPMDFWVPARAPVAGAGTDEPDQPAERRTPVSHPSTADTDRTR